MTQDPLSSSHSPIPPTSEEHKVSWLRLLRSRRVGVTTFHRLMAEHGSADAAVSALPDIAEQAGVRGYSACPVEDVERELTLGNRAGAQLIGLNDPNYPPHLAKLDDAPPLLWTLGDTSFLTKPMIALVGARNASSLGTRMTQALARDLSDAGYIIVSGLARGVDTAAHVAALGGGTVAVQAGGVDVIYPAENTVLAQDIAAKGVRLSEQPIGLQPKARHFPTRNRIISGLAQAVVVVEAAAKSGSLITARNALDQGRDVLAVPGHPFDARAAGCNMLIRDGATLIRSAQDVIDMLPRPQSKEPQFKLDLDAAPTRSLAETAELHSQILSRLSPSPIAEDQLIRDLKLAPDQISPALTDLELTGKIDRQSGGLLSLAMTRN